MKIKYFLIICVFFEISYWVEILETQVLWKGRQFLCHYEAFQMEVNNPT